VNVGTILHVSIESGFFSFDGMQFVNVKIIYFLSYFSPDAHCCLTSIFSYADSARFFAMSRMCVVRDLVAIDELALSLFRLPSGDECLSRELTVSKSTT
jgi:hypothetical protein